MLMDNWSLILWALSRKDILSVTFQHYKLDLELFFTEGVRSLFRQLVAKLIIWRQDFMEFMGSKQLLMSLFLVYTLAVGRYCM